MAKAPKAPKEPKAEKPKAQPVMDAEFDEVGPAPEAPKPPKAVKADPVKAPALSQGVARDDLKKHFEVVRETLMKTHSAVKRPRQLRWALKCLQAAEEAAERHVKHNV